MTSLHDLTQITNAVLTGLADVLAQVKRDRILAEDDTITSLTSTIAKIYAKAPIAMSRLARGPVA